MIPDAAVEAAAKALMDAIGSRINPFMPQKWQDGMGVRPFDAANLRNKALLAALEAAAPHLMAQTAELIADGMQAWAGDSERAYVQGFAEAAWGKATK